MHNHPFSTMALQHYWQMKGHGCTVMVAAVCPKKEY
jgi:hypothetical protein